MPDARIFADLKQDHDNHRALLDRIEKAKKATDRQHLFETFRIEVTAHAAAEEESLYATMLRKPDLREEAQHSVSEHKEIDDFLEELAAMDIEADIWMKKFGKMRDRYLHHIDEEEEEMFVEAGEQLSSEEEAELARIFENRKPQELERAAQDAD